MLWSEQDIKLIDALSVIRSQPLTYLRQRVVTADVLAFRVADDARRLGCEPVEVVEHEGCWLVGAGDDWCIKGRHVPSDVLELFRRAWPFPEAGANSMRSEVLVAAFARDVFTGSADDIQVVQGAEPGETMREWIAARRWRRVIGFRMDRPIDEAASKTS